MPVTSAKPMSEAEKILAATGVQYSHRNDHILAPSKIGEVRAKNVLAVSVYQTFRWPLPFWSSI